MSVLAPTTPIEKFPDGRLIVKLYAQDGTLVEMPAKDTPHNRMFIVWLRQFDRYGNQEERKD